MRAEVYFLGVSHSTGFFSDKFLFKCLLGFFGPLTKQIQGLKPQLVISDFLLAMVMQFFVKIIVVLPVRGSSYTWQIIWVIHASLEGWV